MRRNRLRTLAAMATGLMAGPLVGPLPGADTVSFSRDILPILSDTCFTCHGPDEPARKASLRLDTHRGALGRGRSGSVAVVPGDAAGSEVIRRLTTSDPDDAMPPAKSNRHVTPAQVELIRRWINQGAAWGRHWAFDPPVRPPVPSVPPVPPVPSVPRRQDGASGIHNPIDLFVQARLARDGLDPSPEATPGTLIRRVTLDLTALPPTPEEVAAFERECADEADRDARAAPGIPPAGRVRSTGTGSAYERLVDRLLASPRFGERMAWDWLEAARYADK